MLTQEKLKEYLRYNPETGIFIWIKSTSNRIKLGGQVGNINTIGYRETKLLGERYLLHRLAFLYVNGEFPENHIDHINGIRDDNRISNLRDVTTHGNMQNMRVPTKRNTVGLLGVSYDKMRNKFKAQICVNSKNKLLGRFDTKEQAHEAYLIAKREFHSTCTI